MVPSKLRKRSAILQETAKEVEKPKTAQEKEQARLKSLFAAINEVAGSPAGRVVFRELEKFCHHNASKVGVDIVSKVVDNNSTGHNAAQELVYLHFRKMIRQSHLIKIEFNKED